MGAETKVAKHPVQLTANSLAVIGASPEYNKLGGRPLKLCDDYGYRGQLFPVNPKYEEIRGRKCYPSVEAIEHDVDMAIVALPFGAVFDAVSACVRKGVKQVIVFSAGFAETGDEGREAEQRIRKLLADSPTRVMGPNTVGYGNVGDGLIANFSMGFELGPEMVKTGPVGFASQSVRDVHFFARRATGAWFQGLWRHRQRVGSYRHRFHFGDGRRRRYQNDRLLYRRAARRPGFPGGGRERTSCRQAAGGDQDGPHGRWQRSRSFAHRGHCRRR